MKRSSLLLLALVAAACGVAEPQPVPLVLDEDACSHCRMAVSQREFAAEAVSRSGHVERFDDIGCLLDWRKEREIPEGTALFVVDFDTGEWLTAEDAHYLRSRAIPTPMGSGLVAFGSREPAVQAKERLGSGELIAWEDLVGEEKS